MTAVPAGTAESAY